MSYRCWPQDKLSLGVGLDRPGSAFNVEGDSSDRHIAVIQHYPTNLGLCWIPGNLSRGDKGGRCTNVPWEGCLHNVIVKAFIRSRGQDDLRSSVTISGDRDSRLPSKIPVPLGDRKCYWHTAEPVTASIYHRRDKGSGETLPHDSLLIIASVYHNERRVRWQGRRAKERLPHKTYRSRLYLIVPGSGPGARREPYLCLAIRISVYGKRAATAGASAQAAIIPENRETHRFPWRWIAIHRQRHYERLRQEIPDVGGFIVS